MKRIVAMIFLALFVLNAFSQSSRRNISFKSISWKVFTGDEMADLDQMFLQAIDMKGEIGPGQIIIGQFSIEKLASMATLFHSDSTISYEFFLNGDRIKNELAKNNFFADVSPFLHVGNNYVVLKCNCPISSSNFLETLSTIQLSLLEGLVFTKFEVKKDTYFGGNLIEANVHNFCDKDLDGKIIGKLYMPDTMELIAENSNCAYTRSRQDLTVDIIFPELKLDLTGKTILVELTLVDKENNEEMVDMLTLQSIF